MMSQFIILTGFETKRKFYINIDNILYFVQSEQDMHCTQIVLDRKVPVAKEHFSIEVQETPEEVQRKIDEITDMTRVNKSNSGNRFDNLQIEVD